MTTLFMINDTKHPITLNRKLLIYIPAFNCVDYIVGLVDEIPEIFWRTADILVIDNCSTDGTVERLQRARAENRWPASIHLIHPEKTLGYSGSQKLAYQIALDSPNIQNVIMLHGDGQYPPELMKQFLPYLESEYGVVYGFRDKTSYPEKEEPDIRGRSGTGDLQCTPVNSYQRLNSQLLPTRITLTDTCSLFRVN